MTSRQFYIMLFVMTISIKIQKLPSLVASTLGKDSYLLVLLFLVLNMIGICLAFWILKHIKNKSFASKVPSIFASFFKKLLTIFMAFYFLSQTMLLYESIQNLFAHVLFYELPWALFSLMLTVCVFYLAFTGIENISLNFELYAFVILVSYIIISIFGGANADFSSILPFETTNFKGLLENFTDFNLWFGDFFLVLFMGKHSKHIKLKWTALVYTVAMLFVTLLYIEFFGIYQEYTPMKPSLISVISEQSMLGVNIGRIDWFFILFTEIGTILSAGVCLYFAKKCLSFAFPKIKQNHLLLILTAIIYFTDIFYLVDTHTQVELFVNKLSYFALAIKLIVLVLMLFLCLHEKIYQKKNKNFEKNSTQNKDFSSNAKATECFLNCSNQKFNSAKTKYLKVSKTIKAGFDVLEVDE